MIALLPTRNPGHEVTIDGYLLPNIEVTEREGRYSVLLDRRFLIEGCAFDELQRWLWIVANAQAIGAGYSCHGENSQAVNPHKVQCVRVDVPPPLRVV